MFPFKQTPNKIKLKIILIVEQWDIMRDGHTVSQFLQKLTISSPNMINLPHTELIRHFVFCGFGRWFWNLGISRMALDSIISPKQQIGCHVVSWTLLKAWLCQKMLKYFVIFVWIFVILTCNLDPCVLSFGTLQNYKVYVWYFRKIV